MDITDIILRQRDEPDGAECSGRRWQQRDVARESTGMTASAEGRQYLSATELDITVIKRPRMCCDVGRILDQGWVTVSRVPGRRASRSRRAVGPLPEIQDATAAGDNRDHRPSLLDPDASLCRRLIGCPLPDPGDHPERVARPVC